MTNPAGRKVFPSLAPSDDETEHQAENIEDSHMMPHIEVSPVPSWIQRAAEMSSEETVPADVSTGADSVENANIGDSDEELNSCSSFSLQECIDEFRARRIRRISTQNRDSVGETTADTGAQASAAAMTVPPKDASGDGTKFTDSCDLELINQNRSNKEQERKCKPCENGFCYCFTSDSGDGGCETVATSIRAAHMRHSRRMRKSESGQFACPHAQKCDYQFKQPATPTKNKDRRQDAFSVTHNSPRKQNSQQQKHGSAFVPPVSIGNNNRYTNAADTAAEDEADADDDDYNSRPLTAVSRLETTCDDDAPLIHIIQELRNNCVISEVRVNKHKMQTQQSSPIKHFCTNGQMQTDNAKKAHFKFNVRGKREPVIEFPSSRNDVMPTAPPMEQDSTQPSETPTDAADYISSSALNTSLKSTESAVGRSRDKRAGRLLQKRLSFNKTELKTHANGKPPPKPPRSSVSFSRQSNTPSFASTTQSVHEAERVIEEFLRRRNCVVPRKKTQHELWKESQKEALKVISEQEKRDKRKSYPLMRTDAKTCIPTQRHQQSTYPSLSDIERTMSKKNRCNYEKNIRQGADKQNRKEFAFGWTEPKINEMLNYDRNANRKQFRSQATQAEPQSAQRVGWQIPPKLDIDTVDGFMRHNLASNMGAKHTPVKQDSTYYATKAQQTNGSNKKLVWSNFSPWKSGQRPKLKSSLKNSSCAFMRNSKKKILRLVSPKKDNKETRKFEVRKTPLRSVGIQTTDASMAASKPQTAAAASFETSSSSAHSPPGSYHSPAPVPTQSDATPNDSNDTQFDFTRVVQSPPRKATRSSTSNATQRKLIFPNLNCATDACCTNRISGDPQCVSSNSSAKRLTQTYRSFHSEFDQDMRVSRMGYILTNIRAKLEASDEHAIRTFEEVERREQASADFDCTDSHRMHAARLRQPMRGNVHRRQAPHPPTQCIAEEPDAIYSEIEEDSMHIMGSPHKQFDNTTGVQRISPARNVEALYAKVNKMPKTHKPCQEKQQIHSHSHTQSQSQQYTQLQPTALGKLIHDSYRDATWRAPKTELPTLPEAMSNCYDSYSHSASPSAPPSVEAPATKAALTYTAFQLTPTQSYTSLSHCQSLNNIRVMEQHSPPKRNRNLSKSDLSLQRSEIFLENLCHGELVLEDGELKRLEKVDNASQEILNQSSDSTPQDASYTSYALPDIDDAVDTGSNAAGSHLGLNYIAPLNAQNQSTPKKEDAPEQIFITKSHVQELQLLGHNKAASNSGVLTAPSLNKAYNSFPNTPQKLQTLAKESGKQRRHSINLGECDTIEHDSSIPHSEAGYDYIDGPNNSSSDGIKRSFLEYTKMHCNRLKNALQRSLRKSKNFLKLDSSLASPSFNFSPPYTTPAVTDRKRDSLSPDVESIHTPHDSSFDLDLLFAMDEAAPVTKQLAKAVSVCRQLPVLEVSKEMVEAERLLLYSNMQQSILQQARQQHELCSARSKKSQQQFKRLFFIDHMRLPVRCNPSQDIFFNYFYIVTFECDGVIKSTQSVECQSQEAIFRDCGIEFVCHTTDAEHAVEPEIHCNVFMLRLRKVSTLALEPQKALARLPELCNSSSASSSCEDIVSRFRLHASFSLNAALFKPYEYVDCQSLQQTNEICLRAPSNSYNIPLIPCTTKSSNVGAEIALVGRSEAHFPKCTFNGFLNVQDPHTLHSWNRCWCTLEGLSMRVLKDENAVREHALFTLDLRYNVQAKPLQMAPPELCARSRSFCLQCMIKKEEEFVDTGAVFFAADTQEDLNVWLKYLNGALIFISTWMQE